MSDDEIDSFDTDNLTELLPVVDPYKGSGMNDEEIDSFDSHDLTELLPVDDLGKGSGMCDEDIDSFAEWVGHLCRRFLQNVI